MSLQLWFSILGLGMIFILFIGLVVSSVISDYFKEKRKQ